MDLDHGESVCTRLSQTRADTQPDQPGSVPRFSCIQGQTLTLSLPLSSPAGSSYLQCGRRVQIHAVTCQSESIESHHQDYGSPPTQNPVS